MGKKYIFVFLFAYCQLQTANFVFGQFFQGVGITGGVTMAKQKWFLEMPDASRNIQKKKNIWGFNGSVRGEFINNDYIRWVTEFQFNQKGCKNKTDSATYKYKLNYLCWNNFIKLQYETFEGFPYILVGPRVEYLLSQSGPGGPNHDVVVGYFNTFNFSWSAGVGYEKIVYGNFKPFIELHFNPDTPFYYAYNTDPLDVRNRAWELRIGVIFRPGGKDDCPAVIY